MNIAYRAPNFSIKYLTIPELRWNDTELQSQASFYLRKIESEANATLNGAIKEDPNELQISESVLTQYLKKYNEIYVQAEQKYASVKTVSGTPTLSLSESGNEILAPRSDTREIKSGGVTSQANDAVGEYTSISKSLADQALQGNVKGFEKIITVNTSAFGMTEGLTPKLTSDQVGNVIVSQNLVDFTSLGTKGEKTLKAEMLASSATPTPTKNYSLLLAVGVIALMFIIK